MGMRRKGKGSKAKALAEPMSKIVTQLQCSLIESYPCGLLSWSSVLLAANTEQTDLLNRACFGRPIVTVEKDKQWFQLGLEEAFYLRNSLQFFKRVGEGNFSKDEEELWLYMESKRDTFPELYKAYSHLRGKNWVVRSGSQYGVDFVAYLHHLAFVHDEYIVLVLSDGDGDENGRLRVWSDFHCTIRLSGSVAKMLLVLHANRNGNGDASPSCLEIYTIEECTVTRWNPEKSREEPTIDENDK